MPGDVLPEGELHRHLFQSDPTPLTETQNDTTIDHDTILLDQQTGPQ